MTAVANRPFAAAGTSGVANAYVTELQKLLAQLTTRLLALVAAAGPFAFAAVLRVQSGTPTDALFGASVHDRGSRSRS